MNTQSTLVHKINFSAKLRGISTERRYIKENIKERKLKKIIKEKKGNNKN